MPRITKRDKESGKGKPKATAADPRKRSSGPPGAGKKSGFKVGPAHAPKDAYLGKAKKIKADLIAKAKAKKNYAKVLKEEGMASNRLGEKGKGRERTTRLVKDPYAAMKDDDSEDSDEEEEDKGQEAELMTAGRKRALSRSPSPPPPPPAPATGPTKKAKGKERERPNDKTRAPSTSTSAASPALGKKPSEATVQSMPKPGKTVASNPGIETPAERQRSMRDIKKEAFSKRFPSNNGTNAGGRRGKSQPNMGARMGALLEQIKRTK